MPSQLCHSLNSLFQMQRRVTSKGFISNKLDGSPLAGSGTLQGCSKTPKTFGDFPFAIPASHHGQTAAGPLTRPVWGGKLQTTALSLHSPRCALAAYLGSSCASWFRLVDRLGMAHEPADQIHEVSLGVLRQEHVETTPPSNARVEETATAMSCSMAWRASYGSSRRLSIVCS